MTRNSYSLNLLAKLMVLIHQTLFNLAIAAIAEAILVLIFAEQVRFLHRLIPRYLKLVNFSSLYHTHIENFFVRKSERY